MATVKVKFRPSLIDGEQGTIFYQIIHHRIVRQQKSAYRLYAYEWDSHLSEVIIPDCNDERRRYLTVVRDKVIGDIKYLHKIISNFECSKSEYTADDVVAEFSKHRLDFYFFSFMDYVIANMKALGRARVSETYTTTLRSFKRFRENIDLALDDIDSDIMLAYESYLKRSGVTSNSSSFYMRNLRAVYNRAVEKELTIQRYPFKYVYTGVDKTVKRAISLKSVKRIKEMNLSMNPSLDFARDMFMFSFYTRGMSFIDIAYLRKSDLNRGVLSYRRRKTGQQLFIKWERCMQEIVDKYDASFSFYLLPIVNPFSDVDERRQYLYSLHNINRSLKIIGERLGLSVSLTMYVARHAWASIAKSKNIPLSIISEGMGHDSEATTRIYLASLDTMAVDNANSMILELL